jgi:hypothetical protein
MSEMSGGHQLGRSVDLKKFTLSDVLEAIGGAMARAKSSKGTSTYKFICTIGKYGEVLKQWLGLLPAGDYGSSICGMYDPLELLAILKYLYWNLEELGAFTILLDVTAYLLPRHNKCTMANRVSLGHHAHLLSGQFRL